MDIKRAMSICLKRGIKVYPEVKGKSFVVCVEDKIKKLGTTKHNTNTINQAIVKTWLYMAEKIENK